MNAVAISPDGTTVVSGSSDKTVRVWNLKTGACEKTLEGHSSSVNAVAISPDGTTVVSGSESGVVIHNLHNGVQTVYSKEEFSIKNVTFPDGSPIKFEGSSDIVNSADNKWYVIWEGNTMKIYRKAEATLLCRLGGGAVSFKKASCRNLVAATQPTKVLMTQRGAVVDE